MEVHAGQTLNTVPYYVSPMNASVFGTYSKMAMTLGHTQDFLVVFYTCNFIFHILIGLREIEVCCHLLSLGNEE